MTSFPKQLAPGIISDVGSRGTRGARAAAGQLRNSRARLIDRCPRMNDYAIRLFAAHRVLKDTPAPPDDDGKLGEARCIPYVRCGKDLLAVAAR